MSSHFPFPQIRYFKACRDYPECGNHILATFTDTSIILYLNCPHEIATKVTSRQNYKKDNNHLNINWVLRPTYSSAIYSSGWGTKQDQEHILALTVSLSGFDELIQHGIAMVDDPNPTVEWEWINDNDPFGDEEDRCVLTLKLRKETLDRFLEDMLLKTADITSFVRKQRRNLLGWNGLEKLMVPDESVFRFKDKSLEKGINLDVFDDFLVGLDINGKPIGNVTTESETEVEKEKSTSTVDENKDKEVSKDTEAEVAVGDAEPKIDLNCDLDDGGSCENTPPEYGEYNSAADDEEEARRQIMFYFGGFSSYYDDPYGDSYGARR